jgi:hypothetical protein
MRQMSPDRLRIERLRAALERVISAAETAARGMHDPGAELMEAIACARTELSR